MTATDRLVGDVLDGRYEILDRIGRGGMATVYRAKDRRLDRIVAVKITREDADDDPESIARFDAEARAVAMLSDAHIVSVFDQGTDRGRPYIVMELVDGTTLKAILVKQGALPLSRALPLLEAIASGLAVAHAAGIINRDVKPENVLISRSGEVKVSDFGLARHSTVTEMTVADSVLGSLSYVSPERLRHQAPVGFSSDVYSAGIVAFEMLTGQKPFEGDSGVVYTAHLDQDVPSPAAINPSIPAWLDALIMACGRRDPSQRPADAGELLRRLRLGIKAMREGTEDDPALIAVMSTGAVATRPEPSPAPKPRPIPKPHDTDPIKLEDEPSPRIPPRRTTSKPPGGPNFVARRVTVGVLAVLLVVALAVGSWWLRDGRYTVMPDVAGHTQTDASRILSEAGLTMATAKDFSEDVPPGSVISTVPDGGAKVLRGATVQAVISQGPERFAVPKLVGLSLDEANAALAQTNLKTGTVKQAYSDSVAEGLVISASQAEGAMVKRDTAIDLVVSQGPKPITVPDFTGKNATDAMSALQDLGLMPTQVVQFDDTVPAGVVISQTPNGGTLMKGDTVTLVVSKGPEMVTIPSGLVGAKDTDAKQILEGLGLKVTFVPITADVVNQHIVSEVNPPSGTSVKPGTMVTLYIK